jgi:hypothetical protein
MLRGERGMEPELFARLLAAPAAPFLAGDTLLAEASSELLARASGGILFVPDLTQLARGEQKGTGIRRRACRPAQGARGELSPRRAESTGGKTGV